MTASGGTPRQRTQPPFPGAYTLDELARLEEDRGELRRGALKLKNKPSRDVFKAGSNTGADTTWVEYWTELGELIKPIGYYLEKYATEDASSITFDADMARMLRFAGSTDRLLADGLDDFFRQFGSDAERGRKLLESITQTVDRLATGDSLLVEGHQMADNANPLNAREVEASRSLIEFTRWVILRRLAEVLGVVGDPPDRFRNTPVNSEAVKQSWLRGFLDKGMPTEAAPGVMLMAQEIGRAISTESTLTAVFDEDDPFAVLTHPQRGLPADLAEVFSGKTAWLRHHRERLNEAYGYDQTGIRDPGTTELDRVALVNLFGSQRRDSFVVIAPTSSGKSRLGHLAVSASVTKRRREERRGQVIVLAPTRALVKQTASDLRQLFDHQDTAGWTVLEGSRDYPQNDENLRLGNYDVAVCIPEKLSALMRIGMPLESTPLIVIDEMQHLVDGSRGRELELLLVDLFRRAPRIRWIGLSASISDNTRELIEQWFATNGKSIVVYSAQYRPVPLELIATDGKKSETRSPFDDADHGRRVDILPSWRRTALAVRNKEWIDTAKNYEYLLRIICGIITAHHQDAPQAPLPSILVFMSGRKLAENLAAVMGLIAESSGGLRKTSPEAQPFVDGRFSSFPGMDEDPSAQELLYDFRQLPPGRLRTQVNNALVAGIAFHTAALDVHLRETVEDAFRRGYVRIMFATDTLKLGVNLPADIVVNGDFVLNIGAGQRLLDKDTVIQRLGRAGRLGLSSTHGTGVLAVSPDFKRAERFDLRIGLDERIGLSGTTSVNDERVMSAATQVERVFSHYLSDWDGGADYSPPLSDEWLLNAAAKLLDEAPRARLDIGEFETLVGDVFARSLPGITREPEPADVIAQLERKRVVAVESGVVRLTRLGRAASAGALGVIATSMVDSVARAARDGAGPLTLLYEVCAADAVVNRGFTYKMKCHEHTAEGTRLKIARYAKSLLSRRRETHPALFRLQGPEAEDVAGAGIRADALRAVIELAAQDPWAASAEQLTALWRASILTDWWGGRTVSKLETMIGGEALLADETDIRALAEGTANVIAMIADYLGTEAADMTFRSLLVFSQELDIGLPGVLSSLARTNDRAMHRERLLGLLPALTEKAFLWDDVTELLDWYQQRSDAVPVDEKSKTQGHEWSGLSLQTNARVRKLIEVQRLLQEDAALRLAKNVMNHRIPSDSYVTMSDQLKEMESADPIAVLDRLLDAFEIARRRIDSPVRGFRIALPAADAEVNVYVATEQVNQEFVHSILGELDGAANAVVVTMAGSTTGVLHHSRFLIDRCAVVEPNLFLEIFARIHQRYAPIADEFDFDDSEWDIEASAELLARMFLNNAPVITRSDLENRLRHDDLVD